MYYGEKLNSISHLVGAVLALIGLGALLTIGIQSGDPRQLFGFTVFGVMLVLLYTMSTLYHSFHPPGLKRVFMVFDHVAIYLLIAGTYTPYMLITLRDGNGWLILSTVWALALAGILSVIFLSGGMVKFAQMVLYLAMGWACAVDIPALEAGLPRAGFLWLGAGGIFYTVGVVFYVL
ncbi:MAG: hemolysin III family protein, partial [Gammaproteobacteria bacterium]|nr:hemolysin III family protein [Gammaproteobacteria bacterium]